MGLDKVDESPVKPAGLSRWRLPLALLLLALILVIAGDAAREALRFDRAGIGAGEVWRLVTGHFVHLGAPHFALNAAGLGLVWFLVGDTLSWQRWLLVCAASLAAMDLGLWYLNPRLDWYVGLSGLLHGILAAGLVERLRAPDPESLLLAAALIGKLAWEQLNGPLPGSATTAGGPVVVDAHLFGAVGGAIAGILLHRRVRAAPAI